MTSRLAEILHRDGDLDALDIRLATAFGLQLTQPAEVLRLLCNHQHDDDEDDDQPKEPGLEPVDGPEDEADLDGPTDEAEPDGSFDKLRTPDGHPCPGPTDAAEPDRSFDKLRTPGADPCPGPTDAAEPDRSFDKLRTPGADPCPGPRTPSPAETRQSRGLLDQFSPNSLPALCRI